MNIADLMTRDPEFCLPDDNLVDVAKLMAQDDVGIIPICESTDTRRLVGCVTDRDIAVRCVAQGDDPSACTAQQVMSTELVTCSPDDDLAEAERLMRSHQLRRILVVDEDGALRGVLALADLARQAGATEVGETVHEISQPPAWPSGV